ncbi:MULTISPECIES: helix-turn-helix domain-containing protein [Streptomyces]|uniref:helix-turn-helix domain-containing protein n=1 Tax=Streptomyces TaxID=1883 RepID=UPI002249442D|nr:helix-turn-helix domain-containing protein [Streptomyces sp. JHD 1]MCX2971419.1 helix-turn-helix domain-containing protein [Streptomyces sp. JHD 1]
MSAGADDAGTPTARDQFRVSLKYWRRHAGMTQTRLAERLGYHNSVVSRWESGDRLPAPDHVRRLDAILNTGGQLTQLRSEAAAATSGLGTLPGLGPQTPLPSVPAPAHEATVGWDPAHWPAVLPHQGVRCPLHPESQCTTPSADHAAALYAAFAQQPGRRVDEDTLHVLTAQHALYAGMAETHGPSGLQNAVEHALHLIARSLCPANARLTQPLLHLAAAHASLAGQLRTLRGQRAAAMALYGRALHWAMLCDDVSLRASLMCDMSSLARLEDDAGSARAYAQALSAIGPGRTWTTALSHLYLARSNSIVGDLGETTRQIAGARDALERLDEHDAREAPWLAGVRGQILVEAGIGGALRDAAAATADRALAQRAVHATQHSLTFVPARERPAVVLLALRLADCYACDGQPDAAIAIASPVLTDARALPMATVARELHGLRTRLAARWPTLAPVREFLDRAR